MTVTLLWCRVPQGGRQLARPLSTGPQAGHDDAWASPVLLSRDPAADALCRGPPRAPGTSTKNDPTSSSSSKRTGLITPYRRQWLDDGIPDRAARLIYRARGATIYEWQAQAMGTL